MIDIVVGLFGALTLSSPAHAAPVLKSLPAPSAQVQRIEPPKKRKVDSVGIDTTSKSAFVADVSTGSVLFAKRPHDVMPIASLTKLMTAMVFLDLKPNLDEEMTFVPEDFDEESKAFFGPGETITRRQALQALLVGSVNAAGVALARTTIGEKAFVEAMNAKARMLHLASPVFVEPTGLNPQNRANAADVAAMLTSALQYPEIRATTEMQTVAIKGKSGKAYEVKSTNLLLGSFLNKGAYHIVGAKTGSLPEAGYCMAQVTRDDAGHEIVVANLASNNHFSRYQDVKALTAWAFDAYAWP